MCIHRIRAHGAGAGAFKVCAPAGRDPTDRQSSTRTHTKKHPARFHSARRAAVRHKVTGGDNTGCARMVVVLSVARPYTHTYGSQCHIFFMRTCVCVCVVIVCVIAVPLGHWVWSHGALGKAYNHIQIEIECSAHCSDVDLCESGMLFFFLRAAVIWTNDVLAQGWLCV